MIHSFGQRFKIFLCYRRDDTGGYAGRLRDRLVRRYGKRNIYMDVHNIDPGDAFPKRIQDDLLSCNVLIVLIDKHWEGKDEQTGGSRLENLSDYVRAEILLALENRIPIIPILIDGAQIPKRLPTPLSELQRRQTMPLNLQTFDSDIKYLFRALHRFHSNSNIYKRVILLAVLGILIGGLFLAVYFFINNKPDPDRFHKKSSVSIISNPGFDERGGDEKTGIISGKVVLSTSDQVNAQDLRIVVYALTNIWWIQPDVSKPLTRIAEDGTWSIQTHLGKAYCVLLVKKDFTAATTIPPESSPVDSDNVIANAVISNN